MEFDTILAVLAYPFEQVWRRLADNPGSRYFLPFVLVRTLGAVVHVRARLAHVNEKLIHKVPLMWLSHRGHHSIDPHHFDKNMGGALTIWDRMFATPYVPKDNDELAKGIGLGDEGTTLQDFGRTFVEPFQHAVRSAIREDQRLLVANAE